MTNYMSTIKNSPIFMGISTTEIDSVLKCLKAVERDYEKDEFILRVGDKVDHFGIILTGSLSVVHEDLWGNRNLISKGMPGSLFGEAFASCPQTAANLSIVADKNCRVMWLSMTKLLTPCATICPSHCKMVQNLLMDLAQKALKFNEKITHMAQRTTKDKLLSYLSAESQRNNSMEFDIPFNRQQLADYLSVERSAMSAQLCKLRDDGMLSFEKNHFILYV